MNVLMSSLIPIEQHTGTYSIQHISQRQLKPSGTLPSTDTIKVA